MSSSRPEISALEAPAAVSPKLDRRHLLISAAVATVAAVGAVTWRRWGKGGAFDLSSAPQGVRNLLMGTATPIFAAQAGPIAPGQPGLNAGGFAYWTGNKPFINIARCAGATWNGVAASTTNRQATELLQLPAGAKASRYIVLHNQVGESYVRPGKYVMTWDGPLKLSFASGAQPSGARVDLNRAETSLEPLTEKNTGGIFMAIEAYNPTGVPQDLKALAIVHEDDLAAHAAGEWLAPSWVAQARMASVVRFMDWGGTNNCPIVTANDFATVDHTDWSRVPPRVMGAAGTKVGCDIWVCLPHKADAGAAAHFFREIAESFPKGKVYVEYSNEVWNWGVQQTHWLANEAAFAKGGRGKAPPLAAGAAVGTLRAWAAAEAALGRERVVRVFAGQSVWFDALSPAFEVSEPSLFDGKPLRSLVDAYAVAPYFDLREGGKTLPATQGNRARSERKDHLQPDSYFLGLADNGIAKAAAGVAMSAQRLKAVAPQARLISYEAGAHEYISLDDYASAKQEGARARVDTERNALVFEEDIVSLFDDGEQAYVFWCGKQPLFISGTAWNARNEGWAPFWVRRLDTRSLRCYASEAALKADQPVQLLPSSSIPEDPSRHYVGNFTRLASIADRIQTLLDGPMGAQVYERYLQALEGAGLTLFMQFCDSNNYGKLGRGAKRSFQFGLKRSHFESDEGYSRAAWFRKLALSRQR